MGESSDFRDKYSLTTKFAHRYYRFDKLTKIFANISAENFDVELILIRNSTAENSEILHFFETKSEIYQHNFQSKKRLERALVESESPLGIAKECLYNRDKDCARNTWTNTLRGRKFCVGVNFKAWKSVKESIWSMTMLKHN